MTASNVRFWILAGAMIVVLNAPICAASPWQLEAGKGATITTGFTRISFSTAFATTPVVVVMTTDQNSDPAALRIDNVSATGFDVALVEPSGSDGAVDLMNFQYVAITPGVHRLPDGQTIAAILHNTTTVQRGSGVGGAEGWDTVPFDATLNANAAVIATIQTTVNEVNSPPGDISVPFLTVATLPPNATSVRIALERSETAPGSVIADETIGIVAFPAGLSGSFFDDGDTNIFWEASTTGDQIRGWGNLPFCFSHTFATSGAYTDPIVVAIKNRHDGGDGGWLRRCSFSGTSIGFVVDEDQHRDTERNHTREAAGVLAFSRPFHATFQGLLAARKTVSIEEDPVNGTTNAFSLPGARARYTVEVESTGRLPIDDNSVSFIDVLPPQTKFLVTDISPGAGPVLFTDGSTSSALTFNFTSLGSMTDDLAFSNNGGASFTYTPTPDMDGADPAITHIRVTPQGAFAGDGDNAAPSFTLEFDVIVK